jgi:hypothetical protein
LVGAAVAAGVAAEQAESSTVDPMTKILMTCNGFLFKIFPLSDIVFRDHAAKEHRDSFLISRES